METRIEKIEDLIKSSCGKIISGKENEELIEDIKEFWEDKDIESLYEIAMEIVYFNEHFKYNYGLGVYFKKEEEVRLNILLLIKDFAGINNPFFQAAFAGKEEWFDLSTLN